MSNDVTMLLLGLFKWGFSRISLGELTPYLLGNYGKISGLKILDKWYTGAGFC